MMKSKFIYLIVFLLINTRVSADDEVSNRPVVRSSEYGTMYAKSVPQEYYGQIGKTRVYLVGKESDVFVCEYGWYAGEIYMGGEGGNTLVRFGPWSRGRQPQKDHLAIGFYRDGKVLREYSTLEMKSLGSGLSNSVSHYTVLNKRIGFRWVQGNSYVYEVEGESGKKFSFDLKTGSLQ